MYNKMKYTYMCRRLLKNDNTNCLNKIIFVKMHITN